MQLPSLHHSAYILLITVRQEAVTCWCQVGPIRIPYRWVEHKERLVLKSELPTPKQKATKQRGQGSASGHSLLYLEKVNSKALTDMWHLNLCLRTPHPGWGNRSTDYRLLEIWELSISPQKNSTNQVLYLQISRGLTLKRFPPRTSEVTEKERTTVYGVVDTRHLTASLNQGPLKQASVSPFHSWGSSEQWSPVITRLHSPALDPVGSRLVSSLNLVHCPAQWRWPGASFWQIPKVSSPKMPQIGHHLLWVIHSRRYQQLGSTNIHTKL